MNLMNLSYTNGDYLPLCKIASEHIDREVTIAEILTSKKKKIEEVEIMEIISW